MEPNGLMPGRPRPFRPENDRSDAYHPRFRGWYWSGFRQVAYGEVVGAVQVSPGARRSKGPTGGALSLAPAPVPLFEQPFSIRIPTRRHESGAT